MQLWLDGIVADIYRWCNFNRPQSEKRAIKYFPGPAQVAFCVGVAFDWDSSAGCEFVEGQILEHIYFARQHAIINARSRIICTSCGHSWTFCIQRFSLPLIPSTTLLNWVTWSISIERSCKPHTTCCVHSCSVVSKARLRSSYRQDLKPKLLAPCQKCRWLFLLLIFYVNGEKLVLGKHQFLYRIEITTTTDIHHHHTTTITTS